MCGFMGTVKRTWTRGRTVLLAAASLPAVGEIISRNYRTDENI